MEIANTQELLRDLERQPERVQLHKAALEEEDGTVAIHLQADATHLPVPQKKLPRTEPPPARAPFASPSPACPTGSGGD